MILVDDGIATGATMLAAVASVRARGASKIIVAVPIMPPETVHELARQVDEVVCLEVPEFFGAVGQFYEEFNQVADVEVINLLKD